MRSVPAFCLLHDLLLQRACVHIFSVFHSIALAASILTSRTGGDGLLHLTRAILLIPGMKALVLLTGPGPFNPATTTSRSNQPPHAHPPSPFQVFCAFDAFSCFHDLGSSDSSYHLCFLAYFLICLFIYGGQIRLCSSAEGSLDVMALLVMPIPSLLGATAPRIRMHADCSLDYIFECSVGKYI